MFTENTLGHSKPTWYGTPAPQGHPDILERSHQQPASVGALTATFGLTIALWETCG